MVKIVKWNNRAVAKLDNWVDYLENEVSFQAASNLLKGVSEKIDFLKKHPTVGRRVPSMKTVRFINLDKHRQMFYRVHGSTAFITDFFDVRQNPDKRPYQS